MTVSELRIHGVASDCSGNNDNVTTKVQGKADKTLFDVCGLI